MMRLLSADLFSMVRSKRFWLGTALMVFVAGIGLMDRVKFLQSPDWDHYLDAAVTEYAAMLFLLAPALGALFINTDYHDGTIRNKLSVGCTRASVYMSNLLTVYLCAVFYTLVYLVVTVPIGLAFMPIEDVSGVLIKLLLLTVMFLSLSSIATFMSTLITNRVALILTVLVAMALMFGSMIIDSMLQAPDMLDDYGGVTYTSMEDGSMKMEFFDKEGNPIAPEDIPRRPNPNYVEEPMRSVLRAANIILPGGQIAVIEQGGIYEYSKEAGEVTVTPVPGWVVAVSSLGLAAIVTVLGMLIFRRKDLK